MNFQIRSSIHISNHYIWRNPELTENKTINIGKLIRHVYIAKLGSNMFSWNLKPGTVWLGPHRSHMVYYTPLGNDTPHGGGVFDHYVVKYRSCTQLSRLRKVSWSTLKFPLRTLEKSYTGPKS